MSKKGKIIFYITQSGGFYEYQLILSNQFVT